MLQTRPQHASAPVGMRQTPITLDISWRPVMLGPGRLHAAGDGTSKPGGVRMVAEVPPQPQKGSRLRATIKALHRGHARALVAAAFVATLILLQFNPPHGKAELVAS